MGTQDMNPTPLLRGARDEFSFRRRIVDLLGAMLAPDSDVPAACKAMVVLLLFFCVTASFGLGMFLIVTFASFFKAGQDPHTSAFVAYFSVHAVLGAAIGFPVTMRMTKLEEAKRLQSKLAQVQDSKFARGQARDGK